MSGQALLPFLFEPRSKYNIVAGLVYSVFSRGSNTDKCDLFVHLSCALSVTLFLLFVLFDWCAVS